jgi:DNA-binding transcriptional LysR family regulator
MVQDIELAQLRVFVVLAEELHFGKAATRLRVAQPALSQQIARLEARLKFRVFDRTSRRVMLTAAGASFLERVRVILGEIDSAVRTGREIASGNVGTVRAGYIATAMLTLLPRIVREFRARHPGVRIELREMSSAPQIESLLQGELDVAITTGSPDDDSLLCFEARRDPLVAVLPKDSPIPRSKSTSPKSLAGNPLIIFPRAQAPAFYDQVVKLCRDSGFDPNIDQEAQSWHMIAQLVSSEMGVAIAPESVQRYRVSGVRYIRLRPGGTVSTTICCQRDGTNPAAKLFVDIARRLTPELIPDEKQAGL